MGFFGRKKEVPVDFFKAKAGVFLERLYNGTISRQTYDQVIRRILYVESILRRYPFYVAYSKGSVSKKNFLDDLKAFYQQLLADGISRDEIYEIMSQVEIEEKVNFNRIVKEDISVGNIKGTIFKVREGHRNGIVLTHGIIGSRYNLVKLAEILSNMGYLVLAIDLPKHNVNLGMELTMGSIAELIRDSIIYLRRERGVRNVAVVGHSLGAVGTLLASVGYTTTTEREIYILWEKIRSTIKKGEMYSRLRPGVKNITLQDMLKDAGFMNLLNEIAAYYKRIKEIILESLKRRDHLGNYFVDCCILLSMPAEVKKAFVGVSLLKRLPDRWIKNIWEKLMHDPLIKKIMKEGNIFGYINEETDALRWGYLRVENPSEFLDYFLNAKEPADFISLIGILSNFSHKDGKTSFIGYYQKKYVLSIPKLFIYGSKDNLLRPFMPGARKKLEETYRAYGNAVIIRGKYNHILSGRHIQPGIDVLTSDVVLQNIILFLNKNMNPNRISGYN